MPVFVAALLGGLINVAGTLVGRVLIALGFSAVTYTGLSTTLDFLKAAAFARLDTLPANILGLLGVLQVGTCISIMASAYVVRMTLAGLTGGSLKRLVSK